MSYEYNNHFPHSKAKCGILTIEFFTYRNNKEQFIQNITVSEWIGGVGDSLSGRGGPGECKRDITHHIEQHEVCVCE